MNPAIHAGFRPIGNVRSFYLQTRNEWIYMTCRNRDLIWQSVSDQLESNGSCVPIADWWNFHRQWQLTDQIAATIGSRWSEKGSTNKAFVRGDIYAYGVDGEYIFTEFLHPIPPISRKFWYRIF